MSCTEEMKQHNEIAHRLGNNNIAMKLHAEIMKQNNEIAHINNEISQ